MQSSSAYSGNRQGDGVLEVSLGWASPLPSGKRAFKEIGSKRSQAYCLLLSLALGTNVKQKQAI